MPVCEVPACKRRTGRFSENTLWICQKHWSRLTKAERRVFARIRRLARKIGWAACDPRAMRIWRALVRRCQLPDSPVV